MDFVSKYDPTRENAGKIYRDLQLANHDEYVINGDLTNELSKSLVEDVNDTAKEGVQQFQGKPFYILVHEKKDQQMERAILRRMIKSEFRPWPEDDTIVFKWMPNCDDLFFCWCLPHYSDMPNMIKNESLYDPEMIFHIKQWLKFDLHCFGFSKDSKGNWISNPFFVDKNCREYQPRVNILLPAAI